MVLLVDLIKGTYFVMWCGWVQGNSDGPMVQLVPLENSNGSAGEYAFNPLSSSKIPGTLLVHHYFIEISHKFTWVW